MITIVITAYAILALTIIAAVVLAARKPEPKPPGVTILDPLSVRKSFMAPSLRNGPSPSLKLGNMINGGTEVLAFDA